MKYVRTKDGRIAEIKENMVVKVSDDATRLVYKNKPHIYVLNGNDDILKQDNNSLIGFKFVGKQEIYYYNLRNMSIPDYVKCLCQRYKDLISTGIIERELKPFVKSIENSLNYTDLVF